MIEFGPFRYESESRILRRNDEEILLPPRVLAVLESLLRRPGRIVPKDEILASAWEGAFVGEDSLTQAISQLRQALGDDPKRPTYIQTVPRRGYRLIVEVSEPLRSQAPWEPDLEDATPTPTEASGTTEVQPVAPTSGEPLRPGARLGRYRVVSTLGSGAMGEVWRARDTELDREVAIKSVPPALADEPEVMRRFQREARMLAAVDHPNIATIHGVEESGGVRFIVMELVEGHTLHDRLENGALPVEEALETARKVAEALEAAHGRGIIHRDLKPGNVMLTPDGRIKLLDFGLAVPVGPADTTDPSQLSSRLEKLTAAGALVGTAPYMSPEQVRGQIVDRRTDIWAFGCVLFEALTGDRPFRCTTAADTVAAILDDEPDWETLPPGTPSIAQVLLRRCLRKDPGRRLHDIADARIEIEEALEEPSEVAGTTARPAAIMPRWVPVAVAVGLIAILGVALVLVRPWLLSSGSSGEVRYADVSLQPGTYLTGGHPDEARIGGQRPSRTALAFTPDGRAIVYAATDGDTTRLYLRRLDNPALAIPIHGTEGASDPFVSSRGDRVGFFAGREIRVVPISGGEARTLVADGVYARFGASWTDDWIVFVRGNGIYRIRDTGGERQQLSVVRLPRPETFHIHPQLLPGGRALLYTILRWELDWESAEIVVQPIGGEPKVLIAGGADARYSPTGHLIFVRQGTLMAAGFDPDRLELTSDPVPVVENVMQAVGAVNVSIDTGAGQFDFSAAGSLIYAAGGTHPEVRLHPVWVGRDGGKDLLPDSPGSNIFLKPRISPDGHRVAYAGYSYIDPDIAVLHLATGETHRLELSGTQVNPVWSHDGTRLAFSSDHEAGVTNLYWIAADLSDDPHRITEKDDWQHVSDWSEDNMLVFVEAGEIWMVDADGATEPERIVGGRGHQWPALSPDERWLAYASDEFGEWQIYRRAFPEGNPVYQMTTGGGTRPAWSHDGRELFYRTGINDRSKMMAVQVDPGAFRPNEPHQELFDVPMAGTENTRNYDVAEDGRFLMVEDHVHPPQPVTVLRLVINWFEDLERRVPRGQ